MKKDVVCFICGKGIFENDDYGYLTCSFCEIFSPNLGNIDEFNKKLQNLEIRHSIQCNYEASFLSTTNNGLLTSLIYACCACESIVYIL